MHFPIVIHKDPDSDYGVTVPDLPGCFSAGETIEAALANTKEAIECHIEGMLQDNESVPEPQPEEVHKSHSDFEDGIWKTVRIDFSDLSAPSLKAS